MQENPALFQSVVKQVTVAVVSFQIHIRIYAALDDSLHQGWRIDTAQNTVRDRCRLEYICALIHLRRDYQITDTLSRKGQGLAVRVANHCIAVTFVTSVQPRRRKPAHD